MLDKNPDHHHVDDYVDPYPERSKEMLSMKDKSGKNMYKRKGNDIVPADGGYVYPGLNKPLRK